MANFCLLPEYVDKFKKGLRDRQIDPAKLAAMSSEERNKFLVNFVGKDSATQVNALFESKLLLKNQKAGYINWAKKVGGITPETRRDLISRIERMDRVLSPKEGEQFLKDLAETRLGVGVSETEAKNIFDLSMKVREKRATWDNKWQEKDWMKDKSWKNDSDRLSWGAAQIELGKYVDQLKEAAGKGGVTQYLNPVKAIEELGGIAKVTKTTLDVSGLFRQGWKTIWTNPGVWQKNARSMFVDYLKTLKNRERVIDAINAEIISRPYYDKMVKGKLAISTVEEAFPTQLPQKIPVLGRVVEASDTAFTGFAYRQRADIFEAELKFAQKLGVNIDDVKELTSIAKMVNSLTGRGNIGGLEPSAKFVNNVFFAPRFVKSQIDLFTQPFTGAGGSNYVRRRATANLIKVVMGTAGVLMLARAVMEDSVELDPTSSDFGQIKIGNTRFDVTGGHRTLVTLAARIIMQKTKSSTTGIVDELNNGTYFSKTGVDVAFDFTQNKLSPIANVIRDLMRQEDFDGNKPTIAGTLNNLFTPLPITNYLELKNDPNSAPILLALMAESVGIGTNTFGKSRVNWEQSAGKELVQFKEKVGEEKFKEANDKFNKSYDEWFQEVMKNSDYQNLSDEDKKDVLAKAKENIKERIFQSYHFDYKQDTKSQKAKKKKLDKLVPPAPKDNPFK